MIEHNILVVAFLSRCHTGTRQDYTYRRASHLVLLKVLGERRVLLSNMNPCLLRIGVLGRAVVRCCGCSTLVVNIEECVEPPDNHQTTSAKIARHVTARSLAFREVAKQNQQRP